MKRTVYVDVVERGKGLVSVEAHGGTILRDTSGGARYRVEDEDGLWIGSARSYREGGALVAKHYGYVFDGVEVDHEWKR